MLEPVLVRDVDALLVADELPDIDAVELSVEDAELDRLSDCEVVAVDVIVLVPEFEWVELAVVLPLLVAVDEPDVVAVDVESVSADRRANVHLPGHRLTGNHSFNGSAHSQ